jgi:hypothetical protein
MQLTIVRLGDDIEEEVVVGIGDQVLTCFLSVCRHAITRGNSYEGSLSLWAADGLEVHETAGEPSGIVRLGDGFRYRIVGVVRGPVLDAGIQFEDELFSTEYEYLDGHSVAVVVDRIQLAID